jgi:hypothetical protein
VRMDRDIHIDAAWEGDVGWGRHGLIGELLLAQASRRPNS